MIEVHRHPHIHTQGLQLYFVVGISFASLGIQLSLTWQYNIPLLGNFVVYIPVYFLAIHDQHRYQKKKRPLHSHKTIRRHVNTTPWLLGHLHSTLFSGGISSFARSSILCTKFSVHWCYINKARFMLDTYIKWIFCWRITPFLITFYF